jgi:hypothetical protein
MFTDINLDDVRALVRRGDKIGALRMLRSGGASLATAQTILAATITPDDEAARQAAIAARPTDPWVQSAPGIFEPKSQTEGK